MSADHVRRMCAQIVHRGPDDDGYYVEPTVALGMRRLSIIDLDGGAQPIFNEDQTICVVQNGEIYNFQELRARLIARGHRFATESDTEVIVHLYEEYGMSFSAHLNGMFAIAIWDVRVKRLILVRDRLGVKPLYYAVVGDVLVFGSEIKCLLEHEAVTRQLDAQAVYNYFCLGYIPQPRSVYADVRKLAPAHRLVAEKGRVREERYWSLPASDCLLTDREECKEQLRELLADAVRIRMISDVPLGAFLSGGIDSSITVALMTQYTSQPVKTFFIDFDDPRRSEREYAQSVARRYGTQHHEFIVRPDAVDVLDKLVHFFDEPFGDSSAIPTYYISQMTRQHVTVALSGDGGDEAFGGYHSYRDILGRRELRGVRSLLGPGGCLVHRLLPRRAPGRRYFRSLGMSNARFFAVGTQEAETREMLSADFLQHVCQSIMDEMGAQSMQPVDGDCDPLAPYTRFDTRWYLPDDVLTKADRMSMAHSLELRGPFLDYRIVELAAQMPVQWKISAGDTKVLLKEAFRDTLPAKVLHPRKRGFSVPLGSWLRSELRPVLEETIHDPEIRASGIFNIGEIEGLAREHLSGTRGRAPQLWRFLFFARWWHAHKKQLQWAEA